MTLRRNIQPSLQQGDLVISPFIWAREGAASICFPFHLDPVKGAGIYCSHPEITFVGVECISL